MDLYVLFRWWFTNPYLQWLKVSGELEAIPELSDAIKKFETLSNLALDNVKLKSVERVDFAAYERIQRLILSSNNITELVADTFYDLTDLVILLYQ